MSINNYEIVMVNNIQNTSRDKHLVYYCTLLPRDTVDT